MGLSPQQKRCLDYLLKGMTYKETAREMDLSPRTIEHYIENIKKKLGVNSLIELIVHYHNSQNSKK